MPLPQSCEWGRDRCRHSVEQAGQGRQKCIFCRLAPDNENLTQHYWSPTVAAKQRFGGHPVLDREKRQHAFDRSRAAHQTRLQRNKGKQRVLRRAAKAETQTEHNIITATKNSGRSNRDGDHVAGGQITLDTKLQSTREHPVVQLHELAKVREDAQRSGHLLGGLVLRNKHGVGVVVIDEKDFAHILSRI